MPEQIYPTSALTRFAPSLRRAVFICVGAALSLVSSTPAWAEVIRWELAGHVTNVQQRRFEGLPELFPIGSDATITFMYDSDTLPVFENEGYAEYHFGSNATSFDFGMMISNNEYAWSRQGRVILRMSAAGLFFDAYLSQMAVAGKPVGNTDLWYPEVLEFWVPFETTSTTLPTSLAEALAGGAFSFGLQAYGERCYLQTCGTNGSVGGQLDSVRQVPSPSSMLIFGIGLTSAAIWRRRARRDSRSTS